MEVMCLRAACRFDPEAETLFLHNGMKLHKSQIHQGGVAVLIEPIFDFAMGLSKLKLDKAEIALLAAILLMQSGKSVLLFELLKHPVWRINLSNESFQNKKIRF